MKKRIVATILACVFLYTHVIAAEETTSLSPPQISAPHAIVMDADTGVIIYEKNKNQKAYPASITKVMTALLAIEHMNSDMDARIPFSHDAVFGIEPGSSHISMDVGESLSFQDALYGLMLASANEVANALAEATSGSMESFSELMTARAKELGAKNTNFTNAHGLPDDNHYTTAYDMALIMREAVKHPEFLDAIGKRTHTIAPTELQPESRILNNSNRMIQPHTDFYNELVVGGKTGYTTAAKHTLVTYGRKEQMNVIVVVLFEEKNCAYTDTGILLDYAFNSYAEQELFDGKGFNKSLPVMQPYDQIDIAAGTVSATADSSFSAFLPKNAPDYIRVETDLPERLSAPVTKGQKLGEIRIYCADLLLNAIPIRAANAAPLIEITPPAEESYMDQSTATSIYLIFVSCILIPIIVLGAFILYRLRPWSSPPASAQSGSRVSQR